MNLRRTSSIIATIAILATASGMAHAAPVIYVASYGSDSNPGTQSQPCLTFGGAYNKTDAGGEIYVLNPGIYNSSTTPILEIGKNITIDGGGGRMGIMTLGVAIQSGTLTLRNLDINSIYDGVDMSPSTSLVVSNCAFNCSGVAVNDLYGSTNVTVVNSSVVGGHRAVWTNPSNTGVSVTLHDDTFTSTTGAAVFIESGTADVTDCTINLCYDGLVADSGGTIDADANTLSHDVIGVLCNTGSTVSISNNNFVSDVIATYPYGSPVGVIASSGNNRFVGDSVVNAPSQTITTE